MKTEAFENGDEKKSNLYDLFSRFPQRFQAVYCGRKRIKKVSVLE